MATMTFRSDSNFACTACVDLANWIVENNYQVKENEPGRNLFTIIYNPKRQLMEIQIPIINN